MSVKIFNRFLLSTLTVTGITAGVAMAGEGGAASGSDFYYMAPVGKHVVTPFFAVQDSQAQLEGGDKSDTGGFQLGSQYEFGVMEGLSVGAELSLSQLGNEEGASESDSSGLNNFDFFVKGSMPAGTVTLKYGALLSLSPGDREEESNGDTNNFTGGHSLTPYFGVEMAMGPGIFGAQLAAELGVGKRTTETSGGGSSKAEGGDETTLTLFYEYHQAAWLVGGALSYASVTDIEVDGAAAAEQISPIMEIEVYGAFKVGMGEVLPSLTRVFTTASDVGGVDIEEFNATELKVAYRIEL